ncbi:MAG: NADH-quinone oxidoreductase subunit M [Nitrospinota bacterium]
MNPLGFPILSWIVFLPLAGAAVVGVWSRREPAALRGIALLFSTAAFALSLVLFFAFRSGVGVMQFTETVPWIPGFGIDYRLGADGISLLLVMLTAFLTPIAILSSWREIQNRVKEFYVAILFLETAMLGVFVALDLFLFYVFWEVMLIPMAILIGVWGGEHRVYAAVKFFLFTMAGSVLMLVAILFLVYWNFEKTDILTFNFLELDRLDLPGNRQWWLFGAFFLSFAIKVPMLPFHTWLPDAHVEAPTAGSVILAGILLKMGTYGFVRFGMTLFPLAAQDFTPLIVVLAVLGILYGALMAYVQPDIKKLVAYSSVSHLGFVMLGLFAFNHQGVQGGILQMVNHGLSTGALFLLVGILYERRHTRLIEDYGGLARVVPAFSAVLLVVTFSSIGLPGLNGFVGEFTLLVGSFQVHRWATVGAALGIILAAVYMLWMIHRVVFGEVSREENRALRDLSLREWAVLAPIVLFVFWIGLAPRPFFNKMEASVDRLLKGISAKAERTASLPNAPWSANGRGELKRVAQHSRR